MNQTSSKLISDMRQADDLTRQTVDRINSQINWLVGLRDAFVNMRQVMATAIKEVEERSVLLFDRDEFNEAVKNIKPIPVQESADSDAEPEPLKEPVWQTTERLMRGRISFSTSEALEAVEKVLGRSLGPNRHQIMLNNFKRKDGVFRRNADRSWTVISAAQIRDKGAKA